MTMGSLLRPALFAMALLGTGCVFKQRWYTVHEARPNPFRPTSSFHLAKLTFESVLIGDQSEEAYLSGLSEEAREHFIASKNDMLAAFARGFASERGKLVTQSSPEGAHVVRANIGFMALRHHRHKKGTFTVVHADVKILDPRGLIVDELVLDGHGLHRFGDALRNAMYAAAENIGEDTATYLNDRTGLEEYAP